MTIIQSANASRSLLTPFFPAEGFGELLPIASSEPAGEPVARDYFDSNISDYTGASTWKDYSISTYNGAVATNLNPELAAIDGDGILRRVSDGFGTIEFSLGNAKSVRLFDSREKVDEVYPLFNGFRNGTVAKHFYDQIIGVLNATPSKRDKNYFSSYDHNTANYVRNTNNWASSVDLSCLSVATSANNRWYFETPGILVTPRHIRVCTHYHQPVGATYRFLTSDGQLRTVTSIGTSVNRKDALIHTLSEDVTGCVPAKVGGAWLTQTAGDRFYCCGLSITTNKYRQIGLGMIGYPTDVYNHGWDQTHLFSLSQYDVNYFFPSLVSYGDLQADIGSGSSGHPTFTLINGELVFITGYFFSNSGPHSWNYENGVHEYDAMIAEADADAIARGNLVSPTGHTVTVATDPTL